MRGTVGWTVVRTVKGIKAVKMRFRGRVPVDWTVTGMVGRHWTTKNEVSGWASRWRAPSAPRSR